MVSQFVAAAARGEPVVVTDVRERFAQVPGALLIRCRITLSDRRSVKNLSIPVPPLADLSPPEHTFVVSFVRAELYNALVTLGASALEFGIDTADSMLHALVDTVLDSFQLDRPRGERDGYGRVINVIERVLEALADADATETDVRLQVAFSDTHDLPVADELSLRRAPTDVFTAVTAGLDGRVICGLDVGGTDVKAVVAVNGRLVALKEHDWNPAACTEVEEMIDPVVSIVRLLRARASGVSEAVAVTEAVLARDTGAAELSSAVERAEALAGTALPNIDAIGLCFPDVVIRNKVVGGEVPKMIGLRSNRAREFEEQFSLLTALDERLRGLVRPGGVVMNTNDGPMAAFTAAVELAASSEPAAVTRGVFAHTLGTDLGTGFVPADGVVPEIPLEVYNLIVDLGDAPATTLCAQDLRSLNNTNTGIPGTLQRYTSQTGAFRLAQRLLSTSAPELLEQARARGYVVEKEIDGAPTLVVPEAPVDQRKAYLAWLMDVAATDERAAAVFERIGEFLAVTWRETEYLLNTGLDERYLFGRLVKAPWCFEQMQRGAARRYPQLRLVAADSEMAFTPLMRELDATDEFTVAQFGQAVGAVYFANMGLLE